MQFSKYESFTVIKGSGVLYCFRFFTKGMAPVTDVMTRGKRFISIVAWHGHLSKISGADSTVEMSQEASHDWLHFTVVIKQSKGFFSPMWHNEKFINLGRVTGPVSRSNCQNLPARNKTEEVRDPGDVLS